MAPVPTASHTSCEGVIIFGIPGHRAAWARFYLEPVDPGDGGVSAMISTIVDAEPPR